MPFITNDGENGENIYMSYKVGRQTAGHTMQINLRFIADVSVPVLYSSSFCIFHW